MKSLHTVRRTRTAPALRPLHRQRQPNSGARTPVPGRWLACVLGLAATTVAGCAAGTALSGGAGAPPAASLGSASVLVLAAPQLALHQGGSVLDAMRASLPGVRISDTGAECPGIAMRGPDTLPGVTEPKVYVDGTATSNTCVLAELGATDVARVEIYPMGVTSRPGYAGNAHGLILVFTRAAGDDLAARGR